MPAHKAKAPRHPKRQLALGDGVACCAAEALAASLRQRRVRVAEADVLALYRATTDDPEEGQGVLEALRAAQGHGLAGVRPVSFREVMPDAVPERCWRELPPGDHATRAGLIVGVDLPGPHAVYATPGGWWSWGGLYDPAAFPGAVIEETWALEWENK